MKKIFNWQLTLCLVSLFISLTLIILSGGKRLCVGFGFMLLAVSLVFFAKYRVSKIVQTLQKTEEEIDEEIEKGDNADNKLLDEVYKEVAVLNKQKKSLTRTFYFCAGLLIVVALLMLI